MTFTHYAGIDPGLHGAVVLLDADSTVARWWDTPLKDKALDELAMWTIISNINSISDGKAMVTVEKVGTRPEQGVVSAFNFGVGYGLWRMALVSHCLPREYVTPAVWVKEMLGGTGGDPKGASLRAARSRWPLLPLGRDKDHDRAQAALLAERGRLRWRRPCASS